MIAVVYALRMVPRALIVSALALAAGCEIFDVGGPDAGSGGAGGGGGAAATSLSSSSSSGGGGPACYVPADCPDPMSECVLRTCEAGACGTAFVAAGTPTSHQKAGDCRRSVCDGHGAEVVFADDADVPIDGDPCTDDRCDTGVADNPPSGPGAPCDKDGGKVCDGAGACVACVTASDCAIGQACVNNACQ